ncbi:MAG: hypothetical protein JXR97_17045 [Planctomycetes bacterium]|nr:hypothetical protein [Planctomycetota bacterium]
MKKRNTVLCLVSLITLAASAVMAGQSLGSGKVDLADILPPSTIICFERPPKQLMDQLFEKTALKKIFDNPDVGSFIDDLNKSEMKFVNEIAETAKLEPAFIKSLFDAQISGALIDVSVDTEDGKGVDTSFVVAFHLAEKPDQKMVFDAVTAAVENYRKRMKTEVPIPAGLSVVNKEAKVGTHDVLRVLGERPLRFVVLDNTIIFYQAERREGLEQIIMNYDNRLSAKTLSKSPTYKSVFAGSEARHGMSFFYINTRRLYALFGALGKPEYMRLLDVLGISGVQAIGCAGGSFKEGFKHTMYLHAPNERHGLLDTLLMKENAEQAALELPGDAPGIMASWVDFSDLYRKLPMLADSVENAIGGKAALGLTNLAGKQTVLGVPAMEMLAPLGDAVIIHPGPGGWAIRFDLVNIEAFKEVIGRMQKNSGKSFSVKTVKTADGQESRVYYFNQSGSPLPLAPSFCITKVRKDKDGKLVGKVYVSTHPQVIESILRHKSAENLNKSKDYMRVMEGMGSGYTVFVYLDNRASYRRIYDAALPLVNIMTAWPGYTADAGKLPPGTEIENYFFGCGLGVKNSQEGITFVCYSPLGMGGLLVSLLDTPMIHGMLATEGARYLSGYSSITDSSGAGPATLDPGESPDLPLTGDDKKNGGIPGIGE